MGKLFHTTLPVLRSLDISIADISTSENFDSVNNAIGKKGKNIFCFRRQQTLNCKSKLSVKSAI